ncbi:MAG: hypothetical protein M1540_05935 [Candidatus Bathyarchaeota archaeon]|nr:hypothetical protein [Candidatus Bathyarchaeota archaeon]
MKRLACILSGLAVVALFFAVSVVQTQDIADPFPTPPTYTIPSTPEPTPTPIPTPTPTPKIVPGSPLSVGSATLQELLSQIDLMSLAQIVVVCLGLMWFIIISVTVAKKLYDKLSSEKS